MSDLRKKSLTAAIGVLTLTSSVMGSGVGLAFANSDNEDDHDATSPTRRDDDEVDSCDLEDIGHQYESEVASDPAVAQAWAAYNAAVQTMKRFLVRP